MSTQLSGETLDGGWMDDIPKFVQPCNWGSTRFRGVVLVLLLSNRIRCAGLLGAMGLLSSFSFAGGPHAVGKVNQLSVPTAQKKLNQASARFIENTGQWPNKALFLARSRNVNVWLTKNGVTFDYFDSKVGMKVSDRKGQVVSMSFKGSSPLNPVGVGQLSYKTQYLKGNGKLKHAAGNYSGAVAKNIYPGVNLHSYYDHEKPRYDLVVKPNADPSVIHLAFHGADKTALVGNTIQLSTQIGSLSQGKLYAYQLVGAKKQQVQAQFVQLGQDEFGFKLGNYDRSKELVIDPLVYGSYYGGDGGFDSVNAITTDNRGGVYLTGYTLAADFPAIDGPYGFTIHGGKDAFVAKLEGDAYNEDYSAYVGGSLDDNAQFITVDPFGDVWIAGKTQSSDFTGNEVYQHPNIQFLQATTSFPNFPPTGGIFQIQYGNGGSTVQLPYNATALEVQNALNALLGTSGVVVTAQPAGSLLSNGGVYRISLPWNFPLLLSISRNTEPVSYVVTPRVDGQAVELAGAGGTNPTAGTFALDFATPGGTVATANIAYNATAAQVQAACNAALGGAYVRVQQETTTNATPFLISFVGQNSPYTNNPPAVTLDPATNLTGSLVINSVSRDGLEWDNRTSIPTGGTFDLLVFNTITGAFLGGAVIPYNASAATIQKLLQAGIGTAGTVITDFEPNPGPSTLPKTRILISFTGALANTAVTLQVISSGITPQPGIGFQPKTGSIFVMRFKQSSSTVLDPVTTETVNFFAAATGIGDEQSVTLASFSIRPEANPAATDPVIFAIGGTVTQPVPEIQGYSGQQSGYIAKYTYSPTLNQFTQDSTITRYVSGGNSIDLNGLVMDLQGSVYVGGTVHYKGNIDTSVTPVFVTTPGVFANGRLLRNDDLFVQKYINSADPTKVLAYSALIGGNDYDSAGGLDYDVDGTTYNTGSTVAIDSNLNLYITGISGSFDFPRTRNVYGETFTNNANVIVTKVNSDASKILYSTNLKTSGAVYPGGISVDPRGDAFVTGNVHPNYYLFPDTYDFFHTTAGNPNQPTKMPLGTINVTSDALVPTNLQPTGGASDIATSKGFLNVLNPSADTLIYGTYLGGALDTKVFAPYVDGFGDVWVMGWVDTYRLYDVFGSTGTPTQYEDFGATDGDLPAAMISPLAFKSTSDAFGYTQVNGVLFGALSPDYPNIVPYNYPPTSGGSPEPTISAVYKMDGWLDKLRVGLASVQGVTFNPTLIPGGLGASTTGTVTLTQAAPNGGADVVLTLLNNTTAASFSGASSSSTLVVTIPVGSTTGTFLVYSNAVTVNTSVQVQATYQGSFQVGLFTVTPWLQQLSLTPNSVVGGNSVTGRITIAALPPTGSGGVPINVLTDTPSLVSFPAGSTVTVPEGQTSVTFTINTNGVGAISFPQVTASELGVGITKVLTLELATLSTISFNPTSVAGGTPSIGTITLNGQASGTLTVNLSSVDPAFTFADGKGNPITSVTFHTGEVAKTFTVVTPYEPASTSDVITASIPSSPVQGNYLPQSISGTLFVTSADLTAISVTPTSVLGGSSSTGTVTINTPAPTGGVVVNLSTSNPTVAQVQTSVTIPAGATVSAPFTITTSVIANTTQVNIIAQRGLVIRSAPLTVQGVNFAVTLSPSSIVGGPSGTVTGTITLTSAAPAAGLSFDLSLPTSQDKYAFFGSSGTATSTATVLGGGLTGNFTINTAIVPSLQSIPITVKVHGQSGATGVTTTLQVRVVGVNSITFSPSVIRGRGQQFTFATITLDAPAPAGGTLVVLTQSLPLLKLQAGGYLVPAGFSSLTIKPGISAVGVSRSLSDTISATPPNGGNSAQAVVVVTR